MYVQKLTAQNLFLMERNPHTRPHHSPKHAQLSRALNRIRKLSTYQPLGSESRTIKLPLRSDKPTLNPPTICLPPPSTSDHRSTTSHYFTLHRQQSPTRKIPPTRRTPRSPLQRSASLPRVLNPLRSTLQPSPSPIRNPSSAFPSTRVFPHYPPTATPPTLPEPALDK